MHLKVPFWGELHSKRVKFVLATFMQLCCSCNYSLISAIESEQAERVSKHIVVTIDCEAQGLWDL